jgi:hypothetical protein
MTESSKPQEDDAWAAASFEGNEREQLRRWAKIPFADKIRWLEEAQRVAEALERSRATARPIKEGPLPSP